MEIAGSLRLIEDGRDLQPRRLTTTIFLMRAGLFRQRLARRDGRTAADEERSAPPHRKG
jgi:hypothetical protein